MRIRELRKTAAIITIIAGSATLFSVFGPGRTGPDPIPAAAPDQQAGDGSFAAATPARLREIEWFMQKYSDLAENGMEPGTAGFHICRPEEDSLWSLKYTVKQSAGKYWWPSASAMYVAHYSFSNSRERSPQVSYQRQIQGPIVEYAVVPQGDGLFRLEGFFDTSAIGVLQAMIGTTDSPVSYVDWFWRTRPAGTLPTDMRAAVVADDQVYLPFSMRDIATGAIEPTVILAKDMDEAGALDLLVKLESG